jgi:hypothetical protein
MTTYHLPLNAATASAETQVRVVTGRGLNAIRSKAERARIAADIADGKVIFTKLTKAQVAAVCGVNTTYVNVVRRTRRQRPDLICRFNTEPVYRVAQAAGWGWVSPKPTITTAWSNATDAERIAFVKKAGPERVWTALAEAVG